MSRIAPFVILAVAVIAAAIWGVFSATKSHHLELQGSVLKVRTGEIDAQNSVAILDLRVTNPSGLPFVVRDVEVSVQNAKGEPVEGIVISRADFKQLLAYNRFLGGQYNDGLAIHDKIAPHQTADRMVAARFEMPLADLEASKQIKVHVQDLDGPVWETSRPVH